MRAVGGTLLALVAALALATAGLVALFGGGGWAFVAFGVACGAALGASATLDRAPSTAPAAIVLGLLVGCFAVWFAIGLLTSDVSVEPETVPLVIGGFGGTTLALASAAVVTGARWLRGRGGRPHRPLVLGALSLGALLAYALVAVQAYGS